MRKYTAQYYYKSFLATLTKTTRMTLATPKLDIDGMLRAFESSKERLLVFDYDV